MLAIDVNVVISACRADAPDHEEMRTWLETAVNDPEPVGVSDVILGATVRILTHPRVFSPATPLGQALAQTADLRAHPGVVTMAPGMRHWEIFEGLCRSAQVRGNLVTDAQQAALAVEHGATWISKDRDFARFPGLRWRHPLER